MRNDSYSYTVRRQAFAEAIEACEQLIRDYEAHKNEDGMVTGPDFNLFEIEAVKCAIIRIQCAEVANRSDATSDEGGK
jgi:hypothetical protein